MPKYVQKIRAKTPCKKSCKKTAQKIRAEIRAKKKESVQSKSVQMVPHSNPANWKTRTFRIKCVRVILLQVGFPKFSANHSCPSHAHKTVLKDALPPLNLAVSLRCRGHGADRPQKAPKKPLPECAERHPNAMSRRDFKGQHDRGNRTESLWEANLPLRGSLRGRFAEFFFSEIFRGF